MLTQTANGDSRLSFWLRVREFAVPPSMIETATARRVAGDWAGACAAAGFDVDLDLRSVARTHGRDTRGPGPGRPAPSGSRPAALAHAEDRSRRAAAPGPDHRAGPVRHRRVATARARCTSWSGPRRPGRTPASGSASPCGTDSVRGSATRRHPHPRPNRRFRSTCTGTCGTRAGPMSCGSARGADRLTGGGPSPGDADRAATGAAGSAAAPSTGGRPRRRSCSAPRGGRTGAVDRAARCPAGLRRWSWSPDADGADGPPGADRGRARRRRRSPRCRSCPTRRPGCCPTWTLLRAGRSRPTGCTRWSPRRWYRTTHAAGSRHRTPDARDEPRLVECRGARHRIGLVDGVLVAAGPRPGRDPPGGAAGRADAALRCRACRPSTRPTASRTASPASGNAWTTATPPVRWPSSRVCSAPTRCCATAPCGTNWRRPRCAGSRTDCSRAGPAGPAARPRPPPPGTAAAHTAAPLTPRRCHRSRPSCR